MLWVIVNRERIPPLPRGMLSAEYEDVDSPERRVMRLLGSRDPRGVRLAMKRYGVNTIDDLIECLEHYTPKRRLGNRMFKMAGRLVGGQEYHPHRKEVLLDARADRDRDKELEEKIRRVIAGF